MNDTYRTPEGFDLYKPLLFPDVTDFRALLTAEKPWDFATMNHHNGYPQAATPAEIIGGPGRVIDRFCSVSHLPNGQHLLVTPTDPLLHLLITNDTFAFMSRISFKANYHEQTDRVLVIANGDIGSRWLAYVHPETVPTFQEATS